MTRRPALLARFAQHTQASASVEFALMVPMLIIMMFGGLEFGHLVWTQHKLADAVRDGARYASRLPVTEVCEGATETITADQIDRVKLVTRTGQLADPAARPSVPGWDDTDVSVTVTCQGFVDTGIYTDLGEAGPVVRVAASAVPYPALFRGFAGISGAFRLGASSNAAVIGL
jgi:TadE-like protein